MNKDKQSEEIVYYFDGKICVSPSIWPGRKLKVQPGDLSEFAPHGNCVYGYQSQKENNPFTSAPLQEACGGVIYFGNDISRDDFDALMRIMNVQPRYVIKPSRHFAVFIGESEQPGKDGYIMQMRVITRFGLRFMFGALDDAEYEVFPEHDMTLTDAFWLFIEQERKRWGVSFQQDSENGLRGVFGGDGHFAREELSFGFMVENVYHNIYRIWSRAWLVTK